MFSSVCRVEPHLHERLHFQPERRRIDDRRVALDDARLLQQLHAPRARRIGKPDLLGQLHDRLAPVLLQGVEDRGVVAVERHGEIP